MARAKLIYDASQPSTRNIRIVDINDRFIYDYIYDKVNTGEITKSRLEEWIANLDKIEKDKTSKQKKFAAKRTLFVNTFLPTLRKENQIQSNDYHSLLKIAKAD